MRHFPKRPVNMNKRVASIVALSLGVIICDRTVAADRPNVVIVITDDQGYGDLSCHGNPVLKTPEIDKLHADSIRLRDYHVSPTCSPTRSAFQTGHWTNRTGVWHTIMGRSMLRENEVTMGQIFKDSRLRDRDVRQMASWRQLSVPT